jgi:hypothetical protein
MKTISDVSLRMPAAHHRPVGSTSVTVVLTSHLAIQVDRRLIAPLPPLLEQEVSVDQPDPQSEMGGPV